MTQNDYYDMAFNVDETSIKELTSEKNWSDCQNSAESEEEMQSNAEKDTAEPEKKNESADEKLWETVQKKPRTKAKERAQEVQVIHFRKMGKQAIAPVRATPGSVGYDLASPYHLTVPSLFGRTMVKFGLQIFWPPGYWGEIRSRSGLACTKGVRVVSSGAVIDQDFRGAISTYIENSEENDYYVKRGDRVSQLIIHPNPWVNLEEVETIPSNEEITMTKRTYNGYGSTGR